MSKSLSELPSNVQETAAALTRSRVAQKSTTLTTEEAERLAACGFTDSVFSAMFLQVDKLFSSKDTKQKP